jgi:excisionase family DNA binding protein
MTEPIEILTADEIARMLRVDRKTVNEAAQRGELPHRRLGRRLLFERGAVLRWLRQADVAIAE